MQRRLRRLVIIGVAMSWVLGLSHNPARAGASAPEPDSVQDNLAIIVNTTNPVDDLSLPELRKVFLGERSHWANGRRITLVMMEPGQPERKALIREVCQMNEHDFGRHFLHGMFTGEVFVSPKTLASPIGVRKFVFNVPGAIGYVRASDVDSSIKVVRVGGRLPTDKEYSLRLPAQAAHEGERQADRQGDQ
jgi:ABC-type phosphate transport system substrate-binding protein